MIIDSSAIVAILRGEEERLRFLEIIDKAALRAMAAPSFGLTPRPPYSSGQLGTTYPPAPRRAQISSASACARTAHTPSRSSASTAATHSVDSWSRT